MENESLFNALADICKPVINPGTLFTAAEVKILCIDAILYFMEKQGQTKKDINDFFKLKGI